ncbi:hypothetical protein EYF80_065522 [Liparis tanakae]|uniref:Uncharacterized protein n=1 Tax=Liparis tanakae TaxID=230148 RepID=A0A4Z2E6F4_9TELE|nr:hypothetical protein EYF80_065522 [Liparis tanakae]
MAPLPRVEAGPLSDCILGASSSGADPRTWRWIHASLPCVSVCVRKAFSATGGGNHDIWGNIVKYCESRLVALDEASEQLEPEGWKQLSL